MEASLSPPVGATRRSTLETAVLLHVGAFLVLATWLFGGNSPAGRHFMLAAGTVGLVLTAFAAASATLRRAGELAAFRWLWPLALLNGIVAASALHPSFRHVTMDGVPLLIPVPVSPLVPSSPLPAVTLESLWLFDGMVLSAFNLAVVVRSRRGLRLLLVVLAANALLLAVVGSLQKLSGATGLYFGAVKSPQVHFFATFVYHNHWGAFALLMTAASLGLVARSAGRKEYRSFWHSPAFGGLVAAFFLAAAVPLSTSRSSTVLVMLLLAGGGIHAVVRIVRHRRAAGLSPAPALLAAGVMTLAAVAAVYQLAGDTLRQRLERTREQIATAQAKGTIGARAVLYRDTWHMARDRPVFGWGMGSYPSVFFTYNTQEPKGDRLPVFYNDAHSDWLQSLAELGFAGTALIALLGILPLLALRRSHFRGPLPAYLLTGCGLVLLYATVEFPFGNPAVVLAWWVCFFAAVRYARLAAQ